MFCVVPKIDKNRHCFGSDDTLWGAPPHDWASLAASRAGLHEQAVVEAALAIKYEPNNARLLENLEAFSKTIR
ncbi:MAG: hypothetical protein EB069_10415 [Actinobacteria bacterium]|nr:hypothetical protein [Actinomycetota bacterium]